MLVANYAQEVASVIFQGTKDEYLNHYYHEVIKHLDSSDYQDERIVIKGCER